MRRNSIILKYLLMIVASLAGSLLLLYALMWFSVYVSPLPIAERYQVKNVLYMFTFFRDYTPWKLWLATGSGAFVLIFALLSLPIILRIKRVSAAVRGIAEGNYRVELKPRGRDELSGLEADICVMARQIDDAFKAQRAAEQSKDEFVINIAHDLRTPLTSVLGYLSLMDEKPLSPEDRAQYTRIALNKAQQLSRQVNDLFELLRMNSSNDVLCRARIRVSQFLLQVQDESYPMMAEADMELRMIDIPSNLYIDADGYLLARVYDNLILNAIRYAQEGKYVDLEAWEQDGSVQLAVTTHANPIPESELQHIFDRLHRIEPSRNSETGGTGLGLAICRSIIELHGGKISAMRTNDGTRFAISLPQTQPIATEINSTKTVPNPS